MSSSLLAIAREFLTKPSMRVQDKKMPAEICNLLLMLKRAPDSASFAAIDSLGNALMDTKWGDQI